MFGSRNQNKGDMALTQLDIENWDMSSATDLEAMFYGCGQLTSLDLSKWNVENVTTMSHLFADCFKLQNVDFTGWNTASLVSVNAMFNHCTSLKTLDMSMFDTSKIEAFPQMFEACSSLERIVGLENWNTTSGHDFNEMFSGCGSLKELNLSTFDTRNADAKHLTEGKYENGVFMSFTSGCGSLEKITFGPNFSFDGIGNCPNGYKFVMPSATKVAGWDGKWYTADGTGYLPSEIPEETAATYYAVKPVNP
jgi:surface protein